MAKLILKKKRIDNWNIGVSQKLDGGAAGYTWVWIIEIENKGRKYSTSLHDEEWSISLFNKIKNTKDIDKLKNSGVLQYVGE